MLKMLRDVEIWYATDTDLNHQLCATVFPRSCPGVGLGIKVYTMSNLGTFIARKLKFGMLLTPDLNLQLCARVVPGTCHVVGLGIKIITGLILS